MVLNALRRILVAVVLCAGIGGIAAAPALADTPQADAPSQPFTPPYRTAD
ncbi:MAG: hypothetical protein ABIQ18_44005 [Umezawaea sp.]